jgi:hypothetical protein
VTPRGESQIYRDLMRFKPDDLSPNAWAVKAGVSRTVWTDMRKHGNPSRRTLEKLLSAAGSSLLEFEALRLGPERGQLAAGTSPGQLADGQWSWTPRALPPLSLVASGLGGEWGDPGSHVELTEIRPSEVIERLPRPDSLAGDAEAYALTIVGGAMWPRFRTGSRVVASPRLPVAIGDDVLVQLRSATGVDHMETKPVLIMQLVKRTTSMFELRQFHPDQTIQVDTAEVDAIHKILGELI